VLKQWTKRWGSQVIPVWDRGFAFDLSEPGCWTPGVIESESGTAAEQFRLIVRSSFEQFLVAIRFTFLI
jgi:hypothetical protein